MPKKTMKSRAAERDAECYLYVSRKGFLKAVAGMLKIDVPVVAMRVHAGQIELRLYGGEVRLVSPDELEALRAGLVRQCEKKKGTQVAGAEEAGAKEAGQ